MKLNDEQRRRLESMSRMHKPLYHKKKGGGGPARLMGTVVGEVYIMVNEYKHVLHKIEGEFWGGDKYAYRTGYWTYAAGGQRIVWGQYTQFLIEKEYKQLLTKARAEGWDIF